MHIADDRQDALSSESFENALSRAQAEFLEMPGLKLTAEQARRLWAVDADLCQAILTALVDARFLVKTRHAAFTRAA